MLTCTVSVKECEWGPCTQSNSFVILSKMHPSTEVCIRHTLRCMDGCWKASSLTFYKADNPNLPPRQKRISEYLNKFAKPALKNSTFRGQLYSFLPQE